jgi:predicted ATPase
VEADFPDWAAAHPELLGYHCGEAGMAKKAAGYRLSAGVQALRRSAMSDALVHLQRGLDLLRELPADEWRTRCELDLTLALGKAQIATQGYATQATGATFTRARALCSALGDPPQVLAVLHGLWTHALMRGELESARAQALALLEAGTQRADPLALLMGHRFSGVTHHPLGEFKRAHALLERGLALYDPQRTATYFAITVDDPKVVMQVYLSWSLMCMGRLRESKWHSAQALEEARRMAHAYTLAHALVGASFVTLTVESPEAGLVRLDELEPLLAEQGIAYYGAVGTLFRGWCLAQLGDAAAERVLAAGMAAYRATGTALYLSGFLRMSAESHLHIGRNALAAVQLREAFAAMEATSQRWDEAELHRVQGRLLLAEGDASGADAAFQRAAAIARAQGASLWALRAATDLARLRAEKGARDQGQKVLEPAFDALDAPVEAPDVRVARTLLAQLR